MKKVFISLLIIALLNITVSAESVTWLSNLNQYVTGNHNAITDFKNGYAVFTTGKMGENWGLTDQKTGVIDKLGKIVMKPISGDVSIDILDDNKLYIGKGMSSKITDLYGDTIVSFDGLLGEFNKNEISYLIKSAHEQGLVKSNGEIIVPCNYKYKVSGDINEYFIFTDSNEPPTDAVVYNADGSFSHNVHSDYIIIGYYKNLLEIADASGYRGLTDIYGNIIIEPKYAYYMSISDNRILASGKEGLHLLDYYGKIIKNYGYGFIGTKMYNGKFLLRDGFGNCSLVTENGEILKEYKEIYSYSTEYLGEGIFSVQCDSSYGEYRLIDGDTGEFIGEEYSKVGEFNEGYANAEDLQGNKFIIDKDGNKYCEEYSPTRPVSEGVLIVYDKDEYNTPGIIYMPKYKSIKLVINGKQVKLTSKVQKKDNRTFYPFRECLENIGATVEWDSSNKTAIGKYGDKTIEFPVGKNEYRINGVKHKMDTVSYIDGAAGRTYIPIRYAAEGLGFTVDWTEGDSENTISIYK